MSALGVSRSKEWDTRRCAGPCALSRHGGPSAAVFAGFVVYPIAYAVWLAGRPSLFIELVEDPLSLPAIVNPLFFVASSWV